MNKKEQYKKILSQEYGISDIEQLITQYRCKVEISCAFFSLSITFPFFSYGFMLPAAGVEYD